MFFYLTSFERRIKDVLYKMMRALKKEGYIYTSFKYGEYEGYREERYYTDFKKILLRHL